MQNSSKMHDKTGPTGQLEAIIKSVEMGIRRYALYGGG